MSQAVAVLAERLLQAYARGVFPMAESADDDRFFWVDPEVRGQLDILNLHIPDRLKRRVLQFPYRVTIDTAFADVIDLCAASHDNRPETWINRPIRDAFAHLHGLGHAHSVEVWSPSPEIVTPAQAGVHDQGQYLDMDSRFRGNDGMVLIGGLYGLALGGLFCGESMVSRAKDASKIALVHLCARLHRAGFTVLDTQFVNDHLQQFGVYEITRADYHGRLAMALSQRCDFTLKGEAFGQDEMALISAYFSSRGGR